MILYHFQKQNKFGLVLWREAHANPFEHEGETIENRQVDKVQGTRIRAVESITTNQAAIAYLTDEQKRMMARFDSMGILVGGRMSALKNRYAPTLKGAVDREIDEFTKARLTGTGVKARGGLELAIKRQAGFLLDSDDMKFLTKKVEVCDDALEALAKHLKQAEKNEAFWNMAIQSDRQPRNGALNIGSRWSEFRLDHEEKAGKRRQLVQDAVGKVKEAAVNRKEALQSAVNEKLGGFDTSRRAFNALYFSAFRDNPEALRTFESDFAADMAKFSTSRNIVSRIQTLTDKGMQKKLLHLYSLIRKSERRTAYEFAQKGLSTEASEIDARKLVNLPHGRHVRFNYVHHEEAHVAYDNKDKTPINVPASSIPVEGEAYVVDVDDVGNPTRITLQVVSAKGEKLPRDTRPKVIEVDTKGGMFRIITSDKKTGKDKVTRTSFEDNLLGKKDKPNIHFFARAA